MINTLKIKKEKKYTYRRRGKEAVTEFQKGGRGLRRRGRGREVVSTTKRKEEGGRDHSGGEGRRRSQLRKERHRMRP